MWCLRASELKKVLAQEGHASPTSKCSQHTCAQIAAHEVDGHSVQPSTWHLYTLLMPPNWRQRGIMWAGIATSEACDSAEEEASSANSALPSAGLETSGATFSDSWGGGLETVAVGAGWHFWWGWDRGNGSVRYGSLQEPIDILHLWSQFSVAPSDSNHWASFLRALDLFNKFRKKWDLSWGSNLNTGTVKKRENIDKD